MYLFQLYPELLHFQPDDQHCFDGLQLFVPLVKLICKGSCSYCPLQTLQRCLQGGGGARGGGAGGGGAGGQGGDEA